MPLRKSLIFIFVIVAIIFIVIGCSINSNSQITPKSYSNHSHTSINVEKKENPGRDDYEQLAHAYQKNKEKFINLLKDGANPNAEKNGVPILFNFAFSGETEAIKILIKYGADPDSMNSYKTTSVAMAAAKGHINTVKVLLDAGADPNLTDKEGKGALTKNLIGTEMGDILQEAGATLYHLTV
ncbi:MULTISPECIES: ankyrin repeat domain-containing protein [Lentibacillus]|uniref:ankyrin repeat domain-containing protein n=1 Tax=Lentibacillus TaxID=175304 RepID=UPI0014707346|nr:MULTISPECIES: ankyrin repeat domain-containing protein [Lentibacillus]